MNVTTSLRQIAQRFLSDRRNTDGALSIATRDLERLLGDVAESDFTWISVDREMPPLGRRVLIYSSLNREVYVGCTRFERWFDDQDHYPDGTAVEIEGVTHWMRFPRKPIAND